VNRGPYIRDIRVQPSRFRAGTHRVRMPYDHIHP
jgi:hypothetical protein